jgi:hypothetical protein
MVDLFFGKRITKPTRVLRPSEMPIPLSSFYRTACEIHLLPSFVGVGTGSLWSVNGSVQSVLQSTALAFDIVLKGPPGTCRADYTEWQNMRSFVALTVQRNALR